MNTQVGWTQKTDKELVHPAKADVLSTKRLSAWWSAVLFLLATTVAVKASDYTYTTNSDDTLTITKYTGPGGDVVIPSVIEGRIVTIIGNNAFGGRGFASSYITNLFSVTIPYSVTIIGDDAFYYCISLTNVTMGASVTSIGNYAFGNCDGLSNITIPAGVTRIGDLAFYSCTSLTAIAVDPGNSAYSSENGVLFNKNHTTLIKYPASNVGSSYSIPDSVTDIGKGAFMSTSLTNVTIPDSVTSIGEIAFYLSHNLTSLTVPNRVESIGDSAFAVSALLNVTIGNRVISIGEFAFAGCWSLSSVIIGNGVTSVAYGAFRSCPSLMGVYFVGNAPRIGSDVFKYDDNATVYYLPGTTGWGLTFGGRPAMQWWDGPQISANGTREDVSLNSGYTLSLAVAMNADNHAGVPVDWWILARAGSVWYYLTNAGQWTQFDGSLFNCHPVYQGGLFNLPTTEVLNVRGLQAGSYTFWFAIDYPTDGILNIGGYILLDSVNVTILN